MIRTVQRTLVASAAVLALASGCGRGPSPAAATAGAVENAATHVEITYGAIGAELAYDATNQAAVIVRFLSETNDLAVKGARAGDLLRITRDRPLDSVEDLEAHVSASSPGIGIWLAIRRGPEPWRTIVFRCGAGMQAFYFQTNLVCAADRDATLAAVDRLGGITSSSANQLARSLYEVLVLDDDALDPSGREIPAQARADAVINKLRAGWLNATSLGRFSPAFRAYVQLNQMLFDLVRQAIGQFERDIRRTPGMAVTHCRAIQSLDRLLAGYYAPNYANMPGVREAAETATRLRAKAEPAYQKAMTRHLKTVRDRYEGRRKVWRFLAWGMTPGDVRLLARDQDPPVPYRAYNYTRRVYDGPMLDHGEWVESTNITGAVLGDGVYASFYKDRLFGVYVHVREYFNHARDVIDEVKSQHRGGRVEQLDFKGSYPVYRLESGHMKVFTTPCALVGDVKGPGVYYYDPAALRKIEADAKKTAKERKSQAKDKALRNL